MSRDRWVRRFPAQSSSSNKVYTVAIDRNGEWGCSCPAWVNKRRRPCKHIIQVQNNMALNEPVVVPFIGEMLDPNELESRNSVERTVTGRTTTTAPTLQNTPRPVKSKRKRAMILEDDAPKMKTPRRKIIL